MNLKRNIKLKLRTDDLKRHKLAELCQFAKEKRITLVYAAKDPIYNHARVLREEIIIKMEQSE